MPGLMQPAQHPNSTSQQSYTGIRRGIEAPKQSRNFKSAILERSSNYFLRPLDKPSELPEVRSTLKTDIPHGSIVFTYIRFHLKIPEAPPRQKAG